MKLKKYLNESSLSRVQKAYSEHDTGTITAFRYAHDCGEGKVLTRKEKDGRNGILKSKLLKRGYGVTKVKGAWMENGDLEVGETSFFVVDLKDTGKLKKDLIKLGKQFEQDAITYAEKSGDYYAISSNKCPQARPGKGKIGVEQKLGKPKFGKKGIDGFSRIGGRAFVFEEHRIVTKFDYPPTEIRSIMGIDDGYPDKQSLIDLGK